MKILVVDDNETNIKVVSSYLKGRNHTVIAALSGEESIDIFAREQPDIVLMDIMMPGIDGYQATQKIKELSGDKWVPVIFMSALSQDDDKVKGLEVGGDDYLTKPVELKVLEAKINAMQRIADIQQTLSKTKDELQAYKDAAEAEHATAHELMSHLVSVGHLIDGAQLQTWCEAAERFSGDLIVASEARSGKIYILVADSTGHGLTAALPLLPVSQVFYTMTRKGFSVSAIVEEMNCHLKRVMPVARFLATTMISIDTNNHSIEIWNGGNPKAYFCDSEGKILHEFTSRSVALGILDDASFDSSTEVVIIKEPGSLVVCSDGLLDAENAEGERYGEERLEQVFTQPGDLMENIKSDVKTFLGELQPNDDISLTVFQCNQNFSG